MTFVPGFGPAKFPKLSYTAQEREIDRGMVRGNPVVTQLDALSPTR